MVGQQYVDAPFEAQGAHVAPADLQCGRGDIDGVHLRAREGPRAGQRDCTGTGADIQDAAYARSHDPGLKMPQREFCNRRARHQHALIHVQLDACEERTMGKIGKRFAFADSAAQELLDAPALPRAEAWS